MVFFKTYTNNIIPGLLRGMAAAFRQVRVVRFSVVSIFFALLMVLGGEVTGQVTIVNYNFNSGTSYPTLSPILASNISCSEANANAFSTTNSGIATGPAAFTQNATAGKAVRLAKSKSWTFTITGSDLEKYSSFIVYYQASISASASTPRIALSYSVDGGSFTSTGLTSLSGSYPRNITTSFTEFQLSLPVSADNPTSSLAIKLTTSTSASSPNFNLDNFQVEGILSEITTGTISGSPFCAGNNLSVPFSISGKFVTGNTFTAELSDASGNFISPVVIGSATRTTAGNITATIPAETPAGSGYRIRVVSDNPNLKGNDNGTNLTINSPPAISSQPSAPAATCAGSGTRSMSVTATGTGLSYSWKKDGVAVANGSGIGGQGTATLTLTNPAASLAGSYTVVVSGTCSSVTSNAVDVVVNIPASITTQPAVPAATCSGSGTQTLTVSAAGSGLSYSWRKGGAAVSNSSIISGQGTATLTLTNPEVSQAGSYDVVVTGTCNTVTSNSVSVTVNRDGYWTGTVSTDWNNINNWECGQLPDVTTDVTISTGLANYPVINTGGAGTARNLAIQASASLTVTGNNSLQVAGTITKSATGTFTATSGTIEMTGSSAQTIPAGTFSGNTIMDLSIDNAAGVTLGGALNISGIVRPVSGNLDTGGNLTLLSTAGQTALISGAGSGSVSGNVTIQRYLASAFGYKYLSSPISNATVAQLSGYLSSTATIAKVYRYDENNLSAGSAISGWVSYTTASNALNVMEGYAVNLGSSSAPDVISLTGTVSNGSASRTLYNHNRTYTQGFNLVGNPYPSPIDWNATSGWTRSNIDGAIYFFSASGDEYSGTYSSYTNGIAGADGDNIIPAMQGFFVHVSTGSASGTLGMTNSVRVNKMNPTFKSAGIDSRQILRFSAGFDENQAHPDPLVLYFDPTATTGFDTHADALKMMNTNQEVPNIYALTEDSRQLSISGMPHLSDSIYRMPVGIKILRNGWINFSAKSIEQLPSDYNIYLYDADNGSYNDLKMNPVYRFYLKSGAYDQRFVLILSKSELSAEVSSREKLFKITRSGSDYLVNILPVNLGNGTLYVRNMAGQTIQEMNVSDQQSVEISRNARNGLYVVTIVAGDRTFSEKTLIRRE